MKLIIFILVLFAFSNVVNAVEKKVVLSIPNMNCITCPITIEKSLKKVVGVKSVSASLEDKEAVVIYEDEITRVEKLLNATSNVGYPSEIKK